MGTVSMTPAQRQARDRNAIRLSFLAGICMLAGKWIAYGLTGSSAILSDAAESVVHILGVGMAAYSVWLSHRPADESHPYGHDKVTYFSAGAEGFLILVAAAYIMYEAITMLLGEPALRNLDSGVGIIALASVVNLVLGLYLVRTGRKTGSLILVANGQHVLTDSWTSFGVVAGLLLTLLTGWYILDPIIALIVAANIVWTGFKLVRQSVAGLMDASDPALDAAVRKVLDAETAARSLRYHERRARRSGSTTWVEFHLLFPPATTLEAAHRHATEIEQALSKALPAPVKVLSHLETLEAHDLAHGESLKH
jgi:cation diffusion facilitator family transporter